jgi:hypothetical protein
VSDSGQALSRRPAQASAAAILVVESLAAVAMWSALPLSWIWVGARGYDATGSMLASGSIALLGLLGTSMAAFAGLARLDTRWVALRRRAGHDQREGALSWVVAVAATFGIIAFLVWYYLLAGAFVLPFMPLH